MVDPNIVKRQLQLIGADSGMWGRPERRELPRILFEDEEVHHVINGRYSGGSATLCATNQRVLLIDKKPLYLTMEDIRYDMISDVMFNRRLVDATVLLGTMHKSIAFTGYSRDKLRSLTVFVQEKIFQARTAQSNPAQPVQDITNNIDYPTPGLSVSQGNYRNPYKMPVVISRRASKFY